MTVGLFAVAALYAAQGAVAASPTADQASTLRASTYVDLEGGVGYSTSPNLSLNGGGGRAFGRASVHVVHTRRSARSSTTLSAYGEDTTYLGRYGSQKLFALSAHHDTAVSEKLRVFGDLNASLNESGQLGTRFISVGPFIDPALPAVPLPTLPDTQSAFLITNGRIYRLGGQIGAQIALSAVDSLTARAGVDHVVLRGTSANNNYNVYIASVGYDRRLNARASIGEVVTVQSTHYSNRGRVTVVTPQATGRLALSDSIDLSGAIGVSFATVNDGGVTRHSTGLAVNGNLCRRGETDQICATIAREQQTATIAGPATVTSAGVTYLKSLDAKQTIQLSASAGRYSQPFSGLSPTSNLGRSSYLTGGAAYTRQLGSRLYSGVNVSWRKIFRDGPAPKADVSVSAFLRLRLGDRK